MSDASTKTPDNARCPHCDHVFVLAEITDEWCASCGKKIPEIILKDVRPKPHMRHPHPLPEPTRAERAEAGRETRLRVSGLVVMLVAILGAIAALAWGAFNQTSGSGVAWWIGGAAGAAFVVGLVMLNSGGGQEE